MADENHSAYQLPPLNALKAFEAVGRHQSFKKATVELCVTQSAVSRQISLLEDYLGVKLLERNNRKTQLTDIGQSYLAALTAAFKGISDSTAALFPSKVHKHFQRSLKIGVGPAFAEYWLTGRIGLFRDKYPQIKLEIHINQNLRVAAPLNDVDVEIYTGPKIFEGYSREPLFQIVDYPVCSPRLIDEPLNEVAELHNYTLLHESSNHWWPRWFEAVGCSEKGQGAGPVIHDETLCVKLAVAGEGIALGDAISTAPYLRSGELIKPVAAGMVTNDWVSILKKEHAHDSAEVTLFCEWLRSEMQQFIASLNI
ncbi:LysR substrate-binding domain-containing protein [Dasania sp. GY-MA-18]|uniref:LysR substrate-binding domain-containing protein n=1 Tax=Dasania phycosphaerae TaxID=2950436 RepID=A0A9J6RKH4_9GAMM|nr:MULTISPECIES: LysR substrate-binding domain-containing protein [Dasania]MCR8922470.1 LysR substrate-binding domain-containing protein [Dasania sp. GY-MA-18]MCZ0864898.1 LysR substrate-binding domain-containing protein [Dasania phycosphaerae]MCZ0868626.1 LysR substrate-binding domain-containing protein [Dasania phycosphaerae]